MQQVKDETLALTKYFMSLPHPAKTTFAIFAVSFLFGVLFAAVRSTTLGAFEILASGVDGIFILGFPALLSALGLFPMRRKAIFRRSVFLALLTVISYGIFYLAAFALSPYWHVAANLVFVGFGLYAHWFDSLFPSSGCLGILVPYVNYCVGLSSSTVSQITTFLNSVPIWIPIILIIAGIYIAASK